MKHPKAITDELAVLKRLDDLLKSQHHNLNLFRDYNVLAALAALADALKGIDHARDGIRWRVYNIERGDYEQQ